MGIFYDWLILSPSDLHLGYFQDCFIPKLVLWTFRTCLLMYMPKSLWDTARHGIYGLRGLWEFRFPRDSLFVWGAGGPAESCPPNWKALKSLLYRWSHFQWFKLHHILYVFLFYVYLVFWMDKNKKCQKVKDLPPLRSPLAHFPPRPPSKWLMVGHSLLSCSGICFYTHTSKFRILPPSIPATLFYSFLFHLTICPEDPSVLLCIKLYDYLTSF